MTGPGFLLIAVVTAVLLVGCGGSQDTRPAGSPRTPVLALLDDMSTGRYEQACDVLDDGTGNPTMPDTDLGDDIRKSALLAVRLPNGTSAQRIAFLNRLEDATQTCAAGLRLRAGQLRARLPAIRREAATAPLHKPFPVDLYEWARGTGSDPEDPWTVMAYHGRWVILSTHGL